MKSTIGYGHLQLFESNFIGKFWQKASEEIENKKNPQGEFPEGEFENLKTSTKLLQLSCVYLSPNPRLLSLRPQRDPIYQGF